MRISKLSKETTLNGLLSEVTSQTKAILGLTIVMQAIDKDSKESSSTVRAIENTSSFAKI